MEQAVHGKFKDVKYDVLITDSFHVGNFDDQDPGFAVSMIDQTRVIFERSWLKVRKKERTAMRTSNARVKCKKALRDTERERQTNRR